jgi:hypothetical protein
MDHGSNAAIGSLDTPPLMPAKPARVLGLGSGVCLVPTGHDVHWAASSSSEYVPAVQFSHAPADTNVPALHASAVPGLPITENGLGAHVRDCGFVVRG